MMTKIHVGALIIGIVIIVTFLGVVNYWYYSNLKNNTQTAEITSQNAIEATSTNVQVVVENPVNTNGAGVPDGWSRRTTEDGGYSFIYRDDWTVDEAWNQYTRIVHKDFKIEIAQQTYVFDGSLEEYSLQQADDKDFPAIVTNQEWMTVSGLPALSENDSWKGGTSAARVIYVVKDGRIYHLAFRTNHKQSDVSSADVETFIDGFKFTNSIADWEVYQDKELGYSFMYPKDWKLNKCRPSAVTTNRVWIEKNGACILIDPLGGTGALEIPNIVEKYSIKINNDNWSYIHNPDYHRFVDVEQKLTPKSHFVSGGDNGFRVHVYLDGVTDISEREQAVSAAIRIIETLTLL